MRDWKKILRPLSCFAGKEAQATLNFARALKIAIDEGVVSEHEVDPLVDSMSAKLERHHQISPRGETASTLQAMLCEPNPHKRIPDLIVVGGFAAMDIRRQILRERYLEGFAYDVVHTMLHRRTSFILVSADWPTWGGVWYGKDFREPVIEHLTSVGLLCEPHDIDGEELLLVSSRAHETQDKELHLKAITESVHVELTPPA